MTLLSYISSVIYLSLAAHREPRWEQDWPQYQALSIGMESCFFIFMILQFFKAYVPQYQNREIRDYRMIAARYIEGDFKLDLFAIIPWPYFISLNHKYERLLFLMKLVRFKKGFTIMDYHTTMKIIKKIFLHHVEKKCKSDTDYANNKFS